MKNKFLIGGSTIAVVVLVLASLSPVVGYNSVESSVKESPLFNVRTKRAINEESETLTCNYLRKGQLLSFPTRNRRTELIQKAIDKISRIDDTAFNRFTKSIINHAYQDDRIENEDIGEIITILHLLRANPNEVKNYIDNEEHLQTDLDLYTPVGNWFPGFFILLFLLTGIIVRLPLILFGIFSSLASCWPRCTTEDCR